MSQVIEIAFKGNRKEFFVWEGTEPPQVRVAVIVDADRGEDLGHVHSVGELAAQRNARVAHGLGGGTPSQKVRRLANESDVKLHATARIDDEDARRKSIDRVRANSLVMKVTDAEWQWDRKKLTLYFTAEKRVDFRTLVRELASMFRTRIELKQIGVRDEAKRLDGYGRCGRQYCSSAWLPELRPVNLGVAKDQKLSLNPSQISGACGRLMCCLRYEHEFYVTTRRRFPKEGRTIRTSRGEERVLNNDLFRERVTLRGEEGEFRTVTLEELRAEIAELGLPFPAPGSGSPSAPRHHVDDDQFDEETEIVDGIPDSGRGEIVVTVEHDDAATVAGDVNVDESGSAEESSSSPATGVIASGDDAPQPGESAEDQQRRRGRRRGRRGGRRGRPGPDGSSSGPSSPPPAPTN